jgi:acyl-CoA reductase-like NAD-dependent aldehyde dehydrogenase
VEKQEHLDKLSRMVATAKNENAHLVHGDEPAGGMFFEPTVLANVQP